LGNAILAFSVINKGFEPACSPRFGEAGRQAGIQGFWESGVWVYKMLSIRIVIPACPESSCNSMVYKGTIPDKPE
jgi:hypothetical protein